MQELTMFYFDGCPHCARAFQWHKELMDEHPEFRQVPLRLIDEHKEPALADTYDYWYVPSYYLGHTKLAEGVKDKEQIRAAFRTALEG